MILQNSSGIPTSQRTLHFLFFPKRKSLRTDFFSVGAGSSLIHVVAVGVFVPNAAIKVAFCLC